MKKDELKKMLKPLIKECIKEVMFEQGTLSAIVSEVVQGLGNPVISESRSAPLPRPTNRLETNQEAKERRNQSLAKRKQMFESIGRDSFNGVDLFEGTTPAPAPSKGGQGALSGMDPRDPGVDISKFMGSSSNWKALVGK